MDRATLLALFDLPFNDLMFQAQQVHRSHWDPNAVQLSTLLSVKTGGCAEDCGYCSQSNHFDTGIAASKLMAKDPVLEKARLAKEAGASRFCMSAAWRNLKDRDVPRMTKLVSEVKALGLETCLTAGMLEEHQAFALKDAGLDYYNHNLDTSPEFYGEIITTRSYDDRLQTLSHARQAGMKVCTGGIIGLGESREDRAGLIEALANLDPQPESVPINKLVPQPGTPLAQQAEIDNLELVRTIAVARIALPNSWVRLSAGRQGLDDAIQALCFLAGANSIFYGDKLLTTGNPEHDHDQALFDKLGLKPAQINTPIDAATAAE